MGLVRIDWEPRTRQLRWFGVLVVPVVCVLLGASVYRRWHDFVAVLPLAALAVGTLMIGVTRPQSLRGLFVGASLLTFPVGWVVSHAFVTLLFFAVFLPAAAIMRLVGHDPMARKLDRAAPSYWTPRKSTSESSRYFRQF